MITAQLSELPIDKIKKIREWLDREECGWLEQCIAARIAVLQVEVTNAALEKPNKTIGDESALPLPPESVNQIKEAAILTRFLGEFKRLRKPETKFQTVKLTI